MIEVDKQRAASTCEDDGSNEELVSKTGGLPPLITSCRN